MQKKTTDTLTMTTDDRNFMTQTEFNNGLNRLNQKFKWLRTLSTEKETERKIPRFAFLKISANTHLAHLQSRTSRLTTQSLQKSQISPTLKQHYSI